MNPCSICGQYHINSNSCVGSLKDRAEKAETELKVRDTIDHRTVLDQADEIGKLRQERDSAIKRIAELEALNKAFAETKLKDFHVLKAISEQNARLRQVLNNIKPMGCACPDLGEGRKSHACGYCIVQRALALSLPPSVELARLKDAVVEKAKGFRDHGEAKNGTHGTLLFEALAALEAHEKNQEAKNGR